MKDKGAVASSVEQGDLQAQRMSRLGFDVGVRAKTINGL